MEVYVIERNKLVRDRVIVGLNQFPEFSVTTGVGYAAVEEIRQRDYQVAFVGVPEVGNSEGMQLLEHLRDIGKPIDIVAMSNAGCVRELSKQKAKFNITAILSAPIDPTEFFRLIARMRERQAAGDGRPASGSVSGVFSRLPPEPTR